MRERERSVLAKQFRKRLAGHEFHHHVGSTAILAKVVGGDDIRMVELARSLGFALETRQHFIETILVEGIGAYGLDGNAAFDDRVIGFVNHAHGAASELTPDFVLAQFARLSHEKTCPNNPKPALIYQISRAGVRRQVAFGDKAGHRRTKVSSAIPDQHPLGLHVQSKAFPSGAKHFASCFALASRCEWRIPGS